jgi:hypothetical protein
MEFTERAHPSFERDDDNGELENGEPLLADQSASNGGDPESKSMPNERKDSTISIVAAVAVASSTSIVAATTTASAGKTPIVTRMYAKRHVVLWVFILLSASNAMQCE